MEEEEKDLEILSANLKGRKKKKDDWITIADACRRLKSHYGSFKKVANMVGVSSQTINEIDALLDLPHEVKQLLLSKSIRSMVVASEIATEINGADKQIEVAKAVVNLNARDARAIINYVKKNPKIPIDECKRRALGDKVVAKEHRITAISFDEETFKKLEKQSKKLKINPKDLAEKVIKDWLENT